MKKAFLKIGGAVLCIALALDLTGGTLAQPERVAAQEDRFVGFHMVYEQRLGDGTGRSGDESAWTEYGSESFRVEGLGSLDFPRMILIGQFNEETWEYDFPGLEGFNCFLAVRELEGGGQGYTGYQGLAGADIKVGDEEDSLSGTVYFGPPLDDSKWNTNDFDYVWTAYRVFQMADGAVYLDGSGNSYGGVGGFTTTTREEYTSTMDGKTETRGMEVTVKMEAVERLEGVRVNWFDGDSVLLSGQTLTVEELAQDPALAPPEGAAWVTVEELEHTGAVTRTAYTLGGEQGISHPLVLLDDRGLGRVSGLTLEEAPRF